MTCDHCWEYICEDFYPHLNVIVEVCFACGLARKVLTWDDGQVEYVYNGYDYDDHEDGA